VDPASSNRVEEAVDVELDVGVDDHRAPSGEERRRDLPKGDVEAL